MKLKKKIITLVLPIILYSCSRLQKGGIGDDGINRVEVEIPYFGELYTFDFYGREISVKIDKEIPNNLDLETNDTAEIRILVKNLNNNNFDKTISMLIAQAKEMDLDAFGYRLLLKKFVKEIFSDKSKNFNEIIMWYGLRTNDLEAILCTSDKKILCYFSCKFEYSFVRENKNKNEIVFYPRVGLNYWNDSKKDLLNVLPILDFDLFENHEMNALTFSNKLPKLGKAIFSKKRSFSYNGTKYKLKTSYNKYVVTYLNDLPMKSLGGHLFRREFSDEVRTSFDSIPLWLKNKTEYQKIDFLLTLVHQAFPHSGGDQIEKFNHVEQSMKDEFVDCEDRATVFCYLVATFTDLEVHLVDGDGHVWSAIKQNIPVSAIKNNLQKTKSYIMCDPGQSIGNALTIEKPYEILDPN